MYKCKWCEKEFPSFGEISRHIKQVHREKLNKREPTIPCRYCGKKFTGYTSRKRHEKETCKLRHKQPPEQSQKETQLEIKTIKSLTQNKEVNLMDNFNVKDEIDREMKYLHKEIDLRFKDLQNQIVDIITKTINSNSQLQQQQASIPFSSVTPQIISTPSTPSSSVIPVQSNNLESKISKILEKLEKNEKGQSQEQIQPEVKIEIQGLQKQLEELKKQNENFCKEFPNLCNKVNKLDEALQKIQKKNIQSELKEQGEAKNITSCPSCGTFIPHTIIPHTDGIKGAYECSDKDSKCREKLLKQIEELTKQNKEFKKDLQTIISTSSPIKGLRQG